MKIRSSSLGRRPRWAVLLGFFCSIPFAIQWYHMFNDLRDTATRKEADTRRDLGVTRPRILCWAKTHPNNHKSKAVHLQQTWGRRCDIFLLLSSQKDPELGTVRLRVREGHGSWSKERAAWIHVYKRYFNEADWFFKADDDAYVIVENLRNFIKDLDTTRAVYYGARFRWFAPKGYMTGGPGYVLSKAALHRLVVDGFTNGTACLQGDIEGDDVELGKCMDNLGIEFGDSRDVIGRHKILPGGFEEFFVSSGVLWENWVSNNYYPQQQGMNCCSDGLISFNWENASQLYLAEFLIYHLRR